MSENCLVCGKEIDSEPAMGKWYDTPERKRKTCGNYDCYKAYQRCMSLANHRALKKTVMNRPALLDEFKKLKQAEFERLLKLWKKSKGREAE